MGGGKDWKNTCLEKQVEFVHNLKPGQIYPLQINNHLHRLRINDFRHLGTGITVIYTDFTRVNRYYFTSLGGGWMRYLGKAIYFPIKDLDA